MKNFKVDLSQMQADRCNTGFNTGCPTCGDVTIPLLNKDENIFQPSVMSNESSHKSVERSSSYDFLLQRNNQSISTVLPRSQSD